MLPVNRSKQGFDEGGLLAGDAEAYRIQTDLNAVFCAARTQDALSNNLDFSAWDNPRNQLPPCALIVPVPHPKRLRGNDSFGSDRPACDEEMHFLHVAMAASVNLVKVLQRKT